MKQLFKDFTEASKPRSGDSLRGLFMWLLAVQLLMVAMKLNGLMPSWPWWRVCIPAIGVLSMMACFVALMLLFIVYCILHRIFLGRGGDGDVPDEKNEEPETEEGGCDGK